MGKGSEIDAGGASVRIGADDSPFNGVVGNVEKRLSTFASNVMTYGVQIAGFGLGLGASLLGTVKGFISSGTALQELSNSTGDTAKNLSAVSFAARKTGVDVSDLTGGLKSMSDVVSKAIQGDKDSIALLSKLGLTADQLNGKLPTDQFELFAEKLAKLSNGQDKIDLVKQIFGSGGANLIPLLNQGSAGIAKLRAEAERLGLVMSNEDAAAAKKLNASLTTLYGSVTGIVNKVGGALAPVLDSVAGYLTDAASRVGKFLEANKALAPQAAIVVAGLTAAGVAIAGIGATFTIVGPLIKVAMLGAAAATLTFNVAAAVTSVATRLLGIAFTATGLAVRIVTGTLGIAAGVIRSIGIVIATSTALAALSAAGYGTLAKSIRILLLVTKLGTAGQIALGAAFALQAGACTLVGVAAYGVSVAYGVATGACAVLGAATTLLASQFGLPVIAIAGIVAAGAGLVTAFFLWTKTGQEVGRRIAGVFSGIKDSIVGAFRYIVNTVQGTLGGIGSGLSNFAGAAGTALMGLLSSAQTAVGSTITLFGELFKSGKQTFAGISDAIAAGNIQMGIDILWAGINVAWLKGVEGITSIWSKLLIDLEGVWDGFQGKVNKGFLDMIGAAANLAADLNPEFMFNPKAKEAAKAGIALGTQAGKDNIDSGVKDRQKERDKRSEAIAGQGPSGAVVEAEAKLAELTGQAALLAAQTKAEQDKLALELQKKGDPAAEAAKAVGSTMTTSAAQARNSSGAASTIAKAFNNGANSLDQKQLDTAKQQLKEQQKTNKTLEKQKPVNIVVVQRK